MARFNSSLLRLLGPAIAFLLCSCVRSSEPATPQSEAAPDTYLGFDRNIYPGDDALPVLRKTFTFASYWLSPPPGEKINTWRGKRGLMKSQGFGFAVLYRGRGSRELRTETAAREKGALDARNAVAAAKVEGFAPGTVIFLDIEEGGRLPATYHAYLRVWADALHRAGYRPGAYCSAIPANEGRGVAILTSDDIRNHIGSGQLVYWVYRDVCPPSPGCVFSKTPPVVSSSGVAYAAIYQFVQSPRRNEYTAGCAASYAQDGNCYAPADSSRAWFLDLNSSASPDPSAPPR
jgi:hypothetical protein